MKVSRKAKGHAVEVGHTGKATVGGKEEPQSLKCVAFLVTMSGLMVATPLKGPIGNWLSCCGMELLIARHPSI